MQVNHTQDVATYAENQALIILEDRVIGLGGQELMTYGLPAPNRQQQVHLHMIIHHDFLGFE